MRRIKSLLLLIAFFTLMPLVAGAQEATTEEDLESTYVDIEERMLLFEEELNQLYALSRFQMNIDLEMPLTSQLLEAVSGRLSSLSKSLNSFTTRWNTYSQAQQVYIADNDSLLNMSAQIQQMQQTVNDTLTFRQQQFDQLSAFSKAEQFIWGQDKKYRTLYKQAQQYSLSPKLASQLEKVKAEESNIFSQAQEYYSQAQQASETFPGLEVRMKGMEKKFVELQSEKANSANSWSVRVADLSENYDLSPKNPNKVEVVDERTPEQIAMEIKSLTEESGRLLDEIMGML